MKEIPVLWLVEHVARELDVACAAAAVAKERYGLDVAIRNIYLHANRSMREYEPLVVVHPFFYYLKGALATEDYVARWPEAVHFNLAWEEIFYKAHVKVKAPRDEFTQKRVLHHAWGRFYEDYLLGSGVPKEHIFVNGNPAYQLYRPPYSSYYKSRDWLAERHGLNADARWIFVPENYRWAFISDERIESMVRMGSDRQELLDMRRFCAASLAQLLAWCNQAAGHEDLEVIFRPRPATNSSTMKEFASANLPSLSNRLHFVKEQTVREWVLASDLVISSYSTTLIEGAVAGKPVFMAEPVAIPDSLYCDWYRHVCHLGSLEDFMEVCLNGTNEDAGELRVWAQSEMLGNGDPIEGLARIVWTLAERGAGTRPKRRDESSSFPRKRGKAGTGEPESLLQRLLGLGKRRKQYFNPVTHENDVFTDEDVRRKVERWRKLLKSSMKTVPAGTKG